MCSYRLVRSQLKEQKTLLLKELTEIKNFAEGIMNKWASLASDYSSLFLNDKLDQLGKRRKENNIRFP